MHVPDEAHWEELRSFVRPVICGWLSEHDSLLGWQNPQCLVSLAEPICAALNLYHFIILREGAQGTNWTGEHPYEHCTCQCMQVVMHFDSQSADVLRAWMSQYTPGCSILTTVLEELTWLAVV